VLRENPLTAVAAAGASLLCLVAVFSPWLTPYDPVASDVSPTAESAMARSSRVAATMRLSTSRPSWSVPAQCAALGR
jgi:hypothetical protein